MESAAQRLVIGVDFDNTIARYDELMYGIALERGLIDAGVARNKKSIRDAIRALPDGELHWRGLQVAAYGPRMHEARVMDGVREFFDGCRSRAVPLYIVSHKTEYANFGKAEVNLRLAALQWLEREGFLDAHASGLREGEVFFEATRAEKIDRIRTLGITHFIDDLEETFCESTFPPGVVKLLLTTDGRPTDLDGVRSFATWAEIHAYLLGGTAS